MRKTLLAFVTSLLMVDPVLAQPALFRRDRSCEQAINTITTTLQENNNVELEFGVYNHIGNAPPDRQLGLVVWLDPPNSRGEAQQILNIFNSPQLLISLSRNVINSCRQASTVTYGIESTNHGKTIGLVNGQIREFQCVPVPPGVNPMDTPTPRWGQVYCP
ncbi:MAG TPA: hypothetical protein V6D27_10840 [Vampirovibrionales bacterium]